MPKGLVDGRGLVGARARGIRERRGKLAEMRSTSQGGVEMVQAAIPYRARVHQLALELIEAIGRQRQQALAAARADASN
jgi:hypothetical protein